MSGEGKPLVGCSQKRALWWELGQAPVVVWVLLKGQSQLFWRQVVALVLWGPRLQARGLLLRGGCGCRWLLQDGAVNWSSDHYLQRRHLPSGHLSTGQALSPSSQDGLDPLRP